MGLDPEGRIAAALGARDTWSGVEVRWPAGDGAHLAPVTLGAAPVFDADENFLGFRGFGLIHPTVNEVRLAYADVKLRHPVTGTIFSLGRARVSACEVVNNLADHLELGFTATMGWNEVKTITGAMLDMEMDKANAHPAHTEEFVLYHTEAVESSGFCIHYKLPHYVTFNSGLDALRRVLLKRDSADQPSIEATMVTQDEEALA